MLYYLLVREIKLTFWVLPLGQRGFIVKAYDCYFLSNFYFFSPNDSPSKTMNFFFISSKKLFSFSKYLTFCNFSPSFPYFSDSKGKMEVE